MGETLMVAEAAGHRVDLTLPRTNSSASCDPAKAEEGDSVKVDQWIADKIEAEAFEEVLDAACIMLSIELEQFQARFGFQRAGAYPLYIPAILSA